MQKGLCVCASVCASSVRRPCLSPHTPSCHTQHHNFAVNEFFSNREMWAVKTPAEQASSLIKPNKTHFCSSGFLNLSLSPPAAPPLTYSLDGSWVWKFNWKLSVYLYLSVFFSPDDLQPNTEQAGAAAGAAGGATAEPSTSQPAKTEETSEKTPGQPDESKVQRLNDSRCVV